MLPSLHQSLWEIMEQNKYRGDDVISDGRREAVPKRGEVRASGTDNTEYIMVPKARQ